MRSFSKLAAVVALAGILPCLSSSTAQERKGDAGALELVGRYQLVSGEKDGQPISDERIKGSTIRIAANAITTFDKDEKEVYVATYEVDRNAKPWRITMTAKVAPDKGEGMKTSGLIEKTGDTIKLVYALPGGKTPTEFKAGEKQQLFVLKKMGN